MSLYALSKSSLGSIGHKSKQIVVSYELQIVSLVQKFLVGNLFIFLPEKAFYEEFFKKNTSIYSPALGYWAQYLLLKASKFSFLLI